ncbi:hypothetical protein ACFFU4_16320 [Roseovarius ramblicola]|uniref:Uncharacterized protein n=2 Tax=Roseovarius ramblicola TaxID=2022336 RepID=A0ABV5I4D0_9RHOB
MRATDSDSVTLRVDWTITDALIAAQYEVLNAGAQQFLVFDRLYETARSGTRTVHPELAYTRLDATGILGIEKLVPPLPEDIDIEQPELPYARLLDPGASLTGRVAVARPVRLNPAYPQGYAMTEADSASAVMLRIGYAPFEEDAAARQINANGEILYSMRHAWVRPRQRLIESAPMELAVHIEPPRQ